MPMTIAVTRNVPGRFRGLLASCMCEIAPGVYTAPRMSAGVRERLWTILEEWWMAYPEGSVLMTWPDASLPGGQNLRSVGLPRQDLRDHYGVFLARRVPAEDGPPGAGTAETPAPGTEATTEDSEPVEPTD